jgi:quinol monooxygenase YgiN
LETRRVINMVEVDCRSDVDKKYNEWYNTVHIPMLLKNDGLLRATRYQLLRGPQGQARYLTVYEFRDRAAMDAFPKTPECTAATDEMNATWKEKGFQIKLAAQYEMIGTWGK